MYVAVAVLVVLWSLLVEAADPRCGKNDNQDDCTVPQQLND